MKKYLLIFGLLFNTLIMNGQECISGNCYDGFGKIIYSNGHEYIGEFKNGDPNGYGESIYVNGDVYFGEYNNGLKHGYGVFKWKNGNYYFGKFKNGQKNGLGVKLEKKSTNSQLRYLINGWKDGELLKRSVKEINDKSGCLIGKCNDELKDGIYTKNNKIRIGNLNKAIVFEKFSHILYDIKIGEYDETNKLKKGIRNFNNNSFEFINKKSGTWNGYYYSNYSKNINLKTWLNDELIEELSINELKNKISSPPDLIISNLEFNDFNSNNLLEANEQATISFNIKNIGEGSAYGIIIQIDDKNNIHGLNYDRNKQINILKPQSVNIVTIPLSGSMSLATGESVFSILISEGNGFDADPINLSIPTQSFIPPDLEIVDFVFISDVGEMKLGEKVNLQFAIQNIGQGIAEDIQIKMIIPDNVFAADETNYSINKLNPGEKKLYDFSFFTNKRFSDDVLNITAKLSEKYDKYAKDKIMSVMMKEDISNALALKVESNISIDNVNIDRFSLNSNVDKNIPVNSKVNNRFAFIIGNEDYVSYQSGLQNEQNVDYAERDATIFKKYCLNTLGVKSENMIFITNATSAKMNQKIDLVTKIVSKLGNKAELIFYYAGHGLPDEITKEPYLIPVDVSSSYLNNAISLDDLYDKLSKTGAKRVIAFVDACFSGGARDNSLLVSRGVKINPKMTNISNNLVVFSASSETQSALPYNKENHGMFTFYILNKLKESSGKISLGELYDYISEEVSLNSLKINQTEQEPNVIFSPSIENKWRNWQLY